MHIHYFQHVAFEGLACIEDWARQKGHSLSVTRWYEQPATQLPEDAQMLIVMGGPMGVYEDEQYPWLAREKALIREAVAKDMPVLGICLGSQLIASALGAKVYPNATKEIGWFPVRLFDDTAPDPTTVFHWHGDTFDLPEGAVHLAESAVCKNQAYRVGEKVIGLQFHFEVTRAAMETMIEHCGHELQAAPYIQTANEMRMRAHLAAGTNKHMFRLLDRLEKMI
ncbi:type 1 glutamine amidotransferase [Chitinophaga lutea]